MIPPIPRNTISQKSLDEIKALSIRKAKKVFATDKTMNIQTLAKKTGLTAVFIVNNSKEIFGN